MLFRVAITLATLVILVSTLPSPWRWEYASNGRVCKDQFAPDGSYTDQGCGTIIHPGNSSVCIQTDWKTTMVSKVYIKKCESGTQYGGRWDMSLGRTMIENKQANVNGMCLTASIPRFTTVEMNYCFGTASQYWFTDGVTIKLDYRDLCLAWSGYLGGQLPGALVNASLLLEPCVPGKPSQQFKIPGADGNGLKAAPRVTVTIPG